VEQDKKPAGSGATIDVTFYGGNEPRSAGADLRVDASRRQYDSAAR
jgi:hypothetical protein